MLSDAEIAGKVNALMLEIGGRVNDSIAMVQQSCPDSEFQAYRRAAARVLAEVLEQVLNPLHAIHPELRSWDEG